MDDKQFTQLHHGGCSLDQLQAAVECVRNLACDYARGKLRGGAMSWSDVDATFQAAIQEFPELEAAALRILGEAEYPRADWQRDVVSGITDLGYDAWLADKLEDLR